MPDPKNSIPRLCSPSNLDLTSFNYSGTTYESAYGKEDCAVILYVCRSEVVRVGE